MQQKKPELYRILVENRKKGNECDDELLQLEFKLDCTVADYKNAFDAISELYRRHPSQDSIFANYLFTLGKVNPEALQEYGNDAIHLQYNHQEDVELAYLAFAENGYLEIATELLFRNAQNFDDYKLKS
jgi:hypothetical protein